MRCTRRGVHSPPNHHGISSACIGLGSQYMSTKLTVFELKDAGELDHNARHAPTTSSSLAPRSSNGTPSAAYSGSIQLTDTPSTSRPFDNSCNVDAVLASSAAGR